MSKRHSFTLTAVVRLAIVVLCLVPAQSAQAQMGSMRNNLAVGFNAGGNSSFVDFSPTVKHTFQPGLTGGLTLRYLSEKYFSMLCAAQLELNYTQRGWNELIDDGSGNTFSCTTHYLEIPFLAHLSWGKEQRGAQFFFNAGPTVGWFLGRDEHYGYTADQPWNTDHRPNGVTQQYGKDVENKLEYGISGGLGVELKTGAGNFTLEGRYFFGLSDMYGNSKADPFGRSANNTITVKVGWLVDILN